MDRTFVVVGNPGSSKSAVFRRLLGCNMKIKRTSGTMIYGKSIIKIVDLPARHSMMDSIGKSSILEILKHDSYDIIINVVDYENMHCQMYLTCQMLEMNLPVILVFNILYPSTYSYISNISMDMSDFLDCPVFLISLNSSSDLLELKNTIFIINSYFDNNTNCLQYFRKLVWKSCRIKSALNIRLATSIASINIRWARISNFAHNFSENTILCKKKSDVFDDIFLHKIFGIPILLLLLYLILILSKVFSSIASYWTNGLAFKISHFIIKDMSLTSSCTILIFICNSLVNAASIVLSFVPTIFFVYFVLQFLDESGYLLRVAIIMSRIMSCIGLTSYSFFPLFISLGCTVPAVTTAKVIKNKRKKISTILMSTFIPCSARLYIFLSLSYIFFPDTYFVIIILLYFLGMFIGTYTCFLISGNKITDNSSTIIRLGDYLMPDVMHLLKFSFCRTKCFIVDMFKVICIAVVILNILNYFHFAVKINDVYYGSISIINYLGKVLTVLFKPLGFVEKTWPAIIAILSGIITKELVIASFLSLNSTMTNNQSIINFVYNVDLFSDANFIQNINFSFSNIFVNKFSAFSYLIFILLYLPCLSVFTTVRSEVGTVWAIVSFSWSMIMAYSVSTFFYQILCYFFYGICNIYYCIICFVIFFLSSLLLHLLSNQKS